MRRVSDFETLMKPKIIFLFLLAGLNILLTLPGDTQLKDKKCRGEWETWNSGIPYNGCYLSNGDCKGNCARGQAWIKRCRNQNGSNCIKIFGQPIFVSGQISDCTHYASGCGCDNITWRAWNDWAVGDGCE